VVLDLINLTLDTLGTFGFGRTHCVLEASFYCIQEGIEMALFCEIDSYQVAYS
jgi:hypothetical protein